MTTPPYKKAKSDKLAKQEIAKRDEHAELAKLVQDSSEKNRQYFFIYLGLLVYVLLMVFSTTDLQLLFPTQGIKLPLIDATLPLIGFYQVVPVFVIAIHFNLLHNLSHHHHKLMRWRDTYGNTEIPRTHLSAFIFDNATLGKGGQFEHWVRHFSNFLCMYLAPVTLGILLWRFTDYQNDVITGWHLLLVCIDIWMVLKLHVDFQQNEQKVTEQQLTDISRSQTVNCFQQMAGNKFRLFGISSFLLFLAIQTVFTYWVATANSESFVQHFPSKQTFSQKALGNPSEQTFGPKALSNLESWLLPVISLSPNEKYDVDFVIEDRSLRGLHAPYIHLAKVDNSKLELANLFGAKLQNAVLENVQLQGASLGYAQLQNAKIVKTNLHGAQLNYVQMQNAYLLEVNLQGAVLMHANMQGADMQFAKLQGAYLLFADVQGTNLKRASMQGADLTMAQMQGANLTGSELQGASLSNTNLQGAELRRTQLQGSTFGALLQGSIISGTGLANVKMTSANQDAFIISPAFDNSPPDWRKILIHADDIPLDNGNSKAAFVSRIQEAQKQPLIKINPNTFFHHRPTVLWEHVIPDWCAKMKDDALIAAVVGLRRNYSQTDVDPLSGGRTYKYDPLTGNDISDTLLIDATTRAGVDRALCVCNRVRGKIDGLQCKK